MTGAVLWDMDGTLVDSEEYHWRSWHDTMASEGSPITYDQFIRTFGQRNDSILPQWLGAGVSVERIQSVGDAKEELYRKLVREGALEPLPGAMDWLKRLNSEGWPQAISVVRAARQRGSCAGSDRARPVFSGPGIGGRRHHRQAGSAGIPYGCETAGHSTIALHCSGRRGARSGGRPPRRHALHRSEPRRIVERRRCGGAFARGPPLRYV